MPFLTIKVIYKDIFTCIDSQLSRLLVERKTVVDAMGKLQAFSRPHLDSAFGEQFYCFGSAVLITKYIHRSYFYHYYDFYHWRSLIKNTDVGGKSDN